MYKNVYYSNGFTYMGLTPTQWSLIQSALAQYIVRYEDHAASIRGRGSRAKRTIYKQIAAEARDIIKEID